MALTPRYSTDAGWTLDAKAPLATMDVATAPQRSQDDAPGIPDITTRVYQAFQAAFTDMHVVPTLEGLVTWLIHTEFKSSFLGKHTLSAKEQLNSIQGILRTLQGGQSSLHSELSRGGRVQADVPPSAQSELPFQVVYSMLKNGFNGLRYFSPTPIAKLDIKAKAQMIYDLIHKGAEPTFETVPETQEGITTVEDSVISSLLRPAHGLSCARAMKLGRGANQRTLCYAGRPDTCDKLIELVTMLFWTEVREGRINLRDWDCTTPIDFRFVINSLISTFRKQDLIAKGEMTEYKLLLDELKLLARYEGTDLVIENPDNRGQKVLVRLNFKVYCGNFNFVSSLEKALPASISGKLRGRLISDSFDDLEALIRPEKKTAESIKKYLAQLRKGKLTSEEELLLRFLICKEAGLPTVIHCRSCVDRTTIAAAMIYALNMWTDLGNPIPNNPLKLLDEEIFKELFWDHIAHAITISSYSRKEGGYKWHTGPFKWFTQHPAVLRLMPARLLQSFNWWDLSAAEQQELQTLSNERIKYFSIKFGKKKYPIKGPSPYFFMLPFLKVMSTIRCIRASKTAKVEFKEVILPALGVALMTTLAAILGEIYGALLFTVKSLVAVIYALYYLGVGIRALCGHELSQRRMKNLRFKAGFTHGLPHCGFQERGTDHTLTLDFAHLFMGLHLAAAAFTLLPEKIIRKGTYIEHAEGQRVPLLFGDTPHEEKRYKL